MTAGPDGDGGRAGRIAMEYAFGRWLTADRTRLRALPAAGRAESDA